MEKGNFSSEPTLSTRTVSQELLASKDSDSNHPLDGFDRKPRVRVREEADGEDKTLPLTGWMNADVLNSPKLTRLLDGLDIETKNLPDDIEPLTPTQPSTDSQDASGMDLVTWSDSILDPHNANSIILPISDETSLSDSPAFENRSTGELNRRQVNQTTENPLENPYSDILFPSGIQVGRPPNPFNELYIFPPALGPAGRLGSFLTLAQLRQNITNQLLNKLALLKRAGINENHPGVLGLMNRLADVAYDSGKMTEANNLYRKVLASQGGDLMASPEKVLHAQVGLIDGLCREGHPLEAKEMLERVSTAMKKRFDRTHIISRRLQKARIEIFNWMEDWDREEPVTRDLVQICLVHLGPRDPETLNAVFRLASVMMGQKRYSESERLHRLTIQLCQEGTEKHHERRCWSFTSLGRVYEAQGKLDDAIELLQESTNQAKESLGHENEAVMIGDYRLARILARRGFLQESEELLLDTLARQTKVLGEAHINPMCTMFELGYTSQQAKRYVEAASWLEKCFHKSLTLSNFEFITRFCTRLGSCYEAQGYHEKALGFYYEAMAFLQAAKKKSDDELFDVEQYVVKIQDLIDGACQHIDEEKM